MDLFQMDFFTYILILMLFVGAFFVVYGCITKKGNGDASQDEGEEFLSIAKKLDTLESSVYEADEAVHMLGDMSKNVFKEFDSKYQELLFLYNLVDEKQKNLTSTGNAEVSSNKDVDEGPDPVVVRDILYSGGNASAIKKKTATISHPAAVPQIVAGGGIDITIDDSRNNNINPKFAHVLQLNKDGKSVEDIARDLDMGKGEVMLILNLGGRRQNA